MNTYLITGGCGFIGSHLGEALLRDGASVRVLDDLSSGSFGNLAPGTEFVRGDVADAETVLSAMEGVDGCFHLAAVASVERSRQDWVNAHRTNVTGAVAVFDAARRCGGRRPVPVVYASSAAVYGDCRSLPISEDADKRPDSAYAADKYGCELHARIAMHLYGVRAIGLRFFNVYGPRQDPQSPYSGVISIFCDRLRRDLPIDIFGDGSQTRDFIFVDDVVRALTKAMNRRPTVPEVFNICSGRQTSILDLARQIAALCGREPQIRLRPRRPGEIVHSLGDCSAARRHLALRSPTDLVVGLRATLAWLSAEESSTAGRRREAALPAESERQMLVP